MNKKFHIFPSTKIYTYDIYNHEINIYNHYLSPNIINIELIFNLSGPDKRFNGKNIVLKNNDALCFLSEIKKGIIESLSTKKILKNFQIAGNKFRIFSMNGYRYEISAMANFAVKKSYNNYEFSSFYSIENNDLPQIILSIEEIISTFKNELSKAQTYVAIESKITNLKEEANAKINRINIETENIINKTRDEAEQKITRIKTKASKSIEIIHIETEEKVKTLKEELNVQSLYIQEILGE